jgi:hypothetical protein
MNTFTMAIYAALVVVLLSVTASRAVAPDEGEQRRLLRGYLAGLRHTDITLRRWVDDTRLVLDRLSRVPSASLPGRLAARVDLNRVACSVIPWGASRRGSSASRIAAAGPD